MLPTYEKIIEKIADEQLQKYLDENKIISDNQSGYQKSHSCETALNMVLQTWEEGIDSNKKIICVFLDFIRAFETIQREILIEEMKNSGIENNELYWYKTYLQNRTQSTIENNEQSNVQINNLGCGTPQLAEQNCLISI